ncbi:SGNH/GDSL hydrolase family protein [Elusimicrobiota bacterium]
MIYRKIKAGQIELKNAAMVAISIFMALLIIYPILSLYYYREKDLGKYHPYFQLAPNKVPAALQTKENSLVIICLGGSTTEFKDSAGLGWPKRVEQLLQNQLKNKNVSVLNQGRQWYTTLHSLINYETNLRQHKPDVLIVMHTINDLLHNADFSYFSHGSFREDYGHFYGPVNDLITRVSLEKRLLNFIGHFWYHFSRKTIDTETFPGEISFENNLKTLIDIAKKDKTRIVLVTQPSLYRKNIPEHFKSALYMLNSEAIGPNYKWSYNTALSGFERYNSIIRRIAREYNVDLIDLETQIPKTLEYFKDDVHYHDKTFTLVSSEITKALLKLLNPASLHNKQSK